MLPYAQPYGSVLGKSERYERNLTWSFRLRKEAGAPLYGPFTPPKTPFGSYNRGATVLGGVRYGSVIERRGEAPEAKRAIGAAVARRLPHGAAVFINAGTTTECAAGALSRHRSLRLITDNVEIASVTRGYENIEVIVPGGTVRGSDGAILGAEAVDFLRQFRTDYAIIGAAAMDERGDLWDFDLAEIQLCRAMMAGTQHVIAALDSTKLSRRAPVRLARLTHVHTLVTDAGAPDWAARFCAEHEIALLIA